MNYAGDITPEQAWERLSENPDAVLVDCRTRAEWDYVGVPDVSALGKRVVFVEWIGYPQGALNARFVAELRAAGVTDGSEVLFLCRSGQRSIGAAAAATADGIAAAYNVLEGFEGPLDPRGRRGTSGWRAAGLPWYQA